MAHDVIGRTRSQLMHCHRNSGVTGGAGIAAFGSGAITISAPVAIKAAAGFGLGYGGAQLSGVQSMQGKLLAGTVGAVALPGGSYLTGLIGSTTLSTAAGGGLAYLGGGLSELGGQYGDKITGFRSSYDLAQINRSGLAAGGAYLLFGEAPLTAAGAAGLIPEGVGATAAELTGATNSAVGGFALEKLMHIGSKGN